MDKCPPFLNAISVRVWVTKPPGYKTFHKNFMEQENIHLNCTSHWNTNLSSSVGNSRHQNAISLQEELMLHVDGS